MRTLQKKLLIQTTSDPENYNTGYTAHITSQKQVCRSNTQEQVKQKVKEKYHCSCLSNI